MAASKPKFAASSSTEWHDSVPESGRSAPALLLIAAGIIPCRVINCRNRLPHVPDVPPAEAAAEVARLSTGIARALPDLTPTLAPALIKEDRRL
jgi:hypothetical protein